MHLTMQIYLFVNLKKNSSLSHKKNPHFSKIIKWYCCIGDIFCIYNGNIEELSQFISLLNSFYSSLEFTLNFSDNRVSFLGMWVIKEKGSIITTIYRKDTDKNTLLLASSFHPTPQKKAPH